MVDDNPDAAESLATLLTLRGHQVEIARDGASALAAVEAFRPDIVLLDIGLPDMNGYDVASCIRRMPGGERMVLIAVTGWGRLVPATSAAGPCRNASAVPPSGASPVDPLSRLWRH